MDIEREKMIQKERKGYRKREKDIEREKRIQKERK